MNGEQITNPVLGPGLRGLTGSEFFSTFIPRAVGLIFVVGGILFFFMFVVGAIQWITSGGDKTALEGARGKITNALIGIILLLVSFAIIRLIQTFFGVDILELDILRLKIE